MVILGTLVRRRRVSMLDDCYDRLGVVLILRREELYIVVVL